MRTFELVSPFESAGDQGEAAQSPTLINSHNKMLSAQLYRYVAARDLYIEKDASINDEIERMRLSAYIE
jgi:excinuclease ABC subunit B